MHTALLTCSDPACDHADEFAGELDAAGFVLCDGCGCLMQVVAIEAADERAVVIHLAAHRARRRVSRAATRRPRLPAQTEVA